MIVLSELDAAQLPRSLDDLDAAAINGNYAEKAGLDPIKHSIAIESPKGPYANVLAVRTADKVDILLPLSLTLAGRGPGRGRIPTALRDALRSRFGGFLLHRVA